MGRTRKASESGVYHAMIHAIEGHMMFLDEQDDKRYLSILRRYMTKHEVEMLAWCLMGNHVHLLPRVPTHKTLSNLMHDTSSAYAKYFNERYGIDGHLQYRRFTSKPVENDQYLLTVVRYIHQNPVPVLSPTCDYRWSSYQEYIGKFAPCIASIDFVLEVIGGTDRFVRFHEQGGEPKGSLDPATSQRLTDAEAHAIAKSIFGTEGMAQLKTLPRNERNSALRTLRSEGLTIRQAASITNISPHIVASVNKP